MTESEERTDEKLDQLLQGMRVLLPGVQVMFAFLLAVPFQQRWKEVDLVNRSAYLVALIATAAASVLLITPAAQHRLLFRDSQAERMLRRGNWYGFAGVLCVGVAISAAVFLVVDVVNGRGAAVTLCAISTAACLWTWVVQPFITRERTQRG
ncbi:MAG: hypothetical protein QOJ92_756 [Frankiales bacterium]|nr:hypothetical protein [Frankiales bacterium]